MHASPLMERLRERGGITADYHGRSLVRHFGDPTAEYQASVRSVAVFDRSHRTRLWASGRAPGQMLNGILTGRLPGPPEQRAGSISVGSGSYHAVLTPKGKMISDLVALRVDTDEAESYLLDVPVAGAEGLKEHLAKFVPPRFAEIREESETTASVTFVGPDAAGVLAEHALGGRVEPAVLTGGGEYDWWSMHTASGLVVACTDEVWPDAWTVYGPADAVSDLWTRAVDDGATPAGLGVWATLRVEGGRPVFGTDMDEGTLPPEAGIVDRAIDHAKGCYTGQEVIVRIRDRGHVNRTLRLLGLGELPTPSPGTHLMSTDGSAKVVGEVRSSVQSPRFGATVALAYVRRGVTDFELMGNRLQLDEVEIQPES